MDLLLYQTMGSFLESSTILCFRLLQVLSSSLLEGEMEAKKAPVPPVQLV